MNKCILAVFFFCLKSSYAQKPNVIFIMTDDHAKRAISAYGDTLMHTPHLDQLASKGVIFDRAFVSNSICGPSRAVFLTGKFSHKNGFMSNHDTFNGGQATLAKYMQNAGYTTAVLGKWHLVSKPQGFNEYKILLGQGEYYNPRFAGSNGDTTLMEGYATTMITDMGLDFIERNKQRSFFLMLHHKAPHRNWMPEEKYLKTYTEKHYTLPDNFFDDYKGREGAKLQDMKIENMFYSSDLKLPIFKKSEDLGTGGLAKANMAGEWEAMYKSLNHEQKQTWDNYYEPIIKDFYAENPTGKDLAQWMYNRYINDYTKTIQSVDDNIGRLMDYLEASGLDKNTIVIYTSDQGFYTGEHGWYDKRYMYEPSFSTPLIIKHPKLEKEGLRNGQMVQNIDLAPTILDLVGEDIPDDMQGKSMKNLLLGRNTKEWRKSLYYHYYENIGWHNVPRHLGVRTERFKLIYFYDIKEWELFDLEKDPQEMNNLYGKTGTRKITKKLKKELKNLIAKYEDDTAVLPVTD